MKNKAFFLDRDGTVIIDKGYLDNPQNIEFIEGIPKFLKEIKGKGYLLIVVSNQSGVARGYFGENTVKNVNIALNNKLHDEYDISIDGFYYCPHHPQIGEGEYKKDCNCRKPKPGMILQAVKDFNIDVETSVMVGDKESDRIELCGLDFIKVDKDTNWSKLDILQKYINQ